MITCLLAAFLLGCGDREEKVRSVIFAIHANGDGTISFALHEERLQSPRGKFSIGLVEVGGVRTQSFTVRNAHYTLVGTYPPTWKDGQRHNLVIDHTKSEGSARYQFEISADEGIEVEEHGGKGEDYVVGHGFTFRRTARVEGSPVTGSGG